MSHINNRSPFAYHKKKPEEIVFPRDSICDFPAVRYQNASRGLRLCISTAHAEIHILDKVPQTGQMSRLGIYAKPSWRTPRKIGHLSMPKSLRPLFGQRTPVTARFPSNRKFLDLTRALLSGMQIL